MQGLRRTRAGYTIVELLAVMVILGLLGTVLAGVMMSQQRFFQRTNEQMIVRRELRTALSLLPADLRTISSSGGDLIAFDASSVTFRNLIGESILCGKTSATSLDLPPLNAARGPITSWFSAPAVGDTLFALRTDSSGVGGAFWTPHRITGISSSSAYCLRSTFTDATGDAGKLRYRLSVTPALPDSVIVGSPVRFVRSTHYSLMTVASGRWYLGRSEHRAGAWSTAVPISGPFVAPGPSGTGGIALQYFDSTGVVVASAASATRVARIDVVLRGQGNSSSGANGQGSTIIKDSVQFRVALRNRQ